MFRITNTTNGLTATWDMPYSGDFGWAAQSVTRDDASLDIEMKQSAARFQGTVNKEKTAIDGTLIANDGGNYPLVLKRSKHMPKPGPHLLSEPCGSNGMSGS